MAATYSSSSLSRVPSRGAGSTSRKSSHARPTITRSAASAMLVGASSESNTSNEMADSDGAPPPSSATTSASVEPAFSEAFDPQLAIRFNQESPLRFMSSLDEALLPQGLADYTFLPDGTLGKGKFSTVHIALKGNQRYAIKHTPLFPHHPLIASRLLREPTILAQLPYHPNLVRVYETIRTPGHFYLVEEYLEGYITLDSYTKSCKDGKLSIEQAKIVLDQLVDVVKNALHRPIFIAHRDIKAENILIHPHTLHLVLLDFGLSTHYSEKEARLTTCCGSPAYHSPELWLSLRKSAGTTRYFGPEIDVWCCGMTMLRCLTGRRCPVGSSHASLAHLDEKVTDALLTLPDGPIRRDLAGFLQLDGQQRWEVFRQYQCTSTQPRRRPTSPERPFKSTTFIPDQPRYSLNLLLEQPSREALTPGTNRSHTHQTDTYRILQLCNPSRYPHRTVVSFFKYCLRCAGILYHQWPQVAGSDVSPVFTTPALDVDSPDPFDTSFSRIPSSPRLGSPIYFHCVLSPPRAPTARPSFLQRLNSPSVRSSSTPPNRRDGMGGQADSLEALDFWLSIQAEGYTEGDAASAYQLRLSDARVVASIRRAVDLSGDSQTIHLETSWSSSAARAAQQEEESRGRQRTKQPSEAVAGETLRPLLPQGSSSSSNLTKRSRRSVSMDVLRPC